MRTRSVFLILYFAVFMNPYVADAGIFENTKSRLLGKWIWEYGEHLRTVTTYEFKEDGAFGRKVTIPILPGDVQRPRIVTGKWSLVTEQTGIQSLLADPNKLILEYDDWVEKTGERTNEVYLVVIGEDETFGGKETLRLMPTDGSLLGTQYFFRSE